MNTKQFYLKIAALAANVLGDDKMPGLVKDLAREIMAETLERISEGNETEEDGPGIRPMPVPVGLSEPTPPHRLKHL